jgi:hypothetical protein
MIEVPYSLGARLLTQLGSRELRDMLEVHVFVRQPNERQDFELQPTAET